MLKILWFMPKITTAESIEVLEELYQLVPACVEISVITPILNTVQEIEIKGKYPPWFQFIEDTDLVISKKHNATTIKSLYGREYVGMKPTVVSLYDGHEKEWENEGVAETLKNILYIHGM